MTDKEILAMMHNIIANSTHYTTWTVSTPHIVALVNQAVDFEREACAKVCDVLSDKHSFEGCYADECAAAIRARGQA